MVLRRLSLAVIAGAVVLAAGLLVTSDCQARGPEQHTAPDLFYNYYVPGNGMGPGAAMYVSPLPTPPLVGHTYITYQPLMPHEYLYHHHRTYVTNHQDGTATRTHVTWR
jgi:hypothetical protein